MSVSKAEQEKIQDEKRSREKVRETKRRKGPKSGVLPHEGQRKWIPRPNQPARIRRSKCRGSSRASITRLSVSAVVFHVFPSPRVSDVQPFGLFPGGEKFRFSARIVEFYSRGFFSARSRIEMGCYKGYYLE